MSKGILNRAIVKIYLQPNNLSEVSDELIYGMAFHIKNEIDNKWLDIETEYGYKGYIKKDEEYLVNYSYEQWLKSRNSIIINNFADVLEKEKIQSRVLITLPRGAYIQKTGRMSEDKVYNEVILVDGTLGWVKSSFIREKRKFNIESGSKEEFREDLCKDSLLYLNTQYRWGGKTSEGIDCSGFCSMVYMLNGVIIYRDAAIKDTFPIKKIEMKNMKKGDLIYFPGHIAMYLGDDRYIHSSNRNDGVSINSLNKNHKEYLEYLAKRILYVGSLF